MATRKVFDTVSEADEYAKGISDSRDAVVVMGNWRSLR